MDIRINKNINIPNQTSASIPTPNSGFLNIFSEGNKLKQKDSSGVVTDLTATGGGGGGLNTITGTSIFNFIDEESSVINTIADVNITNSNIKTVSFINTETSETSLDDFNLNGVTFNIENIIDNTSFDIRATAINNASGNYTIKYIINY